MELCSPVSQIGMNFGGAKTMEVATVMRRVLFDQRAGSVLLRITRAPYDEAGHIEIAVLEFGPPTEQHLGRPAADDVGEQPEGPPRL